VEKMYQDVSMQASGPETFAALMRVIHSDSYEALSVGEYQRTHTGEHQVEVVSW
jgi:hypothetical protein